jgi:AcrR family transcriptional regulator
MVKKAKSALAAGPGAGTARRAAAGKPVAGKPAADKPAADKDDSRANILTVATQEFSEKGFSGGRVDEIAERTNTSKRMIYYYFHSKEKLYRAVLENCYAHVRQIDTSLDLDSMPPLVALRELVRVTFDYHNEHPDFVRIVMTENINKGAHIGAVSSIKNRAKTIVSLLQKLIDRGVAAGDFRSDIDPVELHMSISALCFYNVSNRYTFGRVFQRNMAAPSVLATRRETVSDIIERWVRA